MLLYEYDEQFHIASEKEISWEEGREEGRKEERKGGINILISACRKMGLNEKEICQMLMEEYGIAKEEAMKFLTENTR